MMNIVPEFRIESGYIPGSIGRIAELLVPTTTIIGGLGSILRQRLPLSLRSFSSDMIKAAMEFGLPQ